MDHPETIKKTNNTPNPVPDLERFWSRVIIIDDEKSCWEWQGAKDKDGYGRIGIERKDFKKIYKTHRLSWELQNGPVPKENCICHHCDNPPCVRPDHLFLGTVWDNNHDKEKKNRQVRGELNGMRKLTEKEIVKIRELAYRGKFSQKEIAAMFLVSQSAISKIVRKERWLHVGFEDMIKPAKKKGL